MTYKIVQWGTGNLGKLAVQSILKHPDLELIGTWVSSSEKAGATRVGLPLNVLVNNAGVMACPQTRTPQGWELQFVGGRQADQYRDRGLLTTLTLAGPGRSDPARLSLLADTAKEVVHQCINKLIGERLIRQQQPVITGAPQLVHHRLGVQIGAQLPALFGFFHGS
jgi:hypothetical protein